MKIPESFHPILAKMSREQKRRLLSLRLDVEAAQNEVARATAGAQIAASHLADWMNEMERRHAEEMQAPPRTEQGPFSIPEGFEQMHPRCEGALPTRDAPP